MPSPTKKKTSVEATGVDRPEHYVYMEKSITKNMTDYNSAKITLGITVRVDPTKAEMSQVQRTIDIVNIVLDNEMEEQVKALTSK